MFTKREYRAWGIHEPSIAISNQAHCRRNMIVPGDQPRHLQNYLISPNSNNSTPLSLVKFLVETENLGGVIIKSIFFSCLEGDRSSPHLAGQRVAMINKGHPRVNINQKEQEDQQL